MSLPSTSGGTVESAATTSDVKKPTKKICCACPETKRARDECIAQQGPESEQCKSLIEAHKECLRKEGFTID